MPATSKSRVTGNAAEFQHILAWSAPNAGRREDPNQSAIWLLMSLPSATNFFSWTEIPFDSCRFNSWYNGWSGEQCGSPWGLCRTVEGEPDRDMAAEPCSARNRMVAWLFQAFPSASI